MMALACLPGLLIALFLPTDGAGDYLWPVLALIITASLVAALACQFGNEKTKAWVEARF
ncbi:hypothetical protein D3C80_2213900 [compost metagenome]